MAKRKRKIGEIILSVVFVMVLALAPVLTDRPAEVKAANFDNSLSGFEVYPSGCLKSMVVNIHAIGTYAKAYGKIAIHTAQSKYGWNNRWTNDGNASWPASIDGDNFVTWGAGDEFCWTDGQKHPVTVGFADGIVNLNDDKTYYVYMWTRATSYGIYPDVLVYTLKTSDGKLTDSNGNSLVEAKEHSHSPEAVSEVAATCTVDGVKAHFKCSDETCGKLFTDEACTTETTLEALKISAAGHALEYAASANVISATCSHEGCQYYGNGLSLQLNALNAESTVYSGSACPGVYLSDSELTVFNSETGHTVSNADIVYYVDEECTTKTNTENSGAVAEGMAPVYAGSYYAELTVEEKSALKAFTVDKADVNLERPAAVTPLIYDGTEKVLITAGNADGGTIKYRMGKSGEFTETLPTASAVGSYDIYYIVAGDKNHNDVEASEENKVTASISRTVPTLTVPTAGGVVYGQTLGDSKLTGGSAVAGEKQVPGVFTWTDTGVRPEVAVGNSTGYSVTFTPEDRESYAVVTCNVTLTVQPKALTLTAENKYMMVFASFPEFTVRCDGLVNGDTMENVFSVLPAAGTEAAGTVSGRYDIIFITSAVLGTENYTIESENNGILVVYPVPVFVPGDGTDTPGGETDTPGSETDTPGSETDTPGSETDTPGSETDTPGSETDTPKEETDNPGSDGESITVPVTGSKNTVNITAKVDGSAAFVNEIKAEEINKVSESSGKSATVEVDLTSLDKKIDSVSLTNTSMKMVADTVADTTNYVESFTIKLTTATVEMDAFAVNAIVEQADGEDIQLNVDDAGVQRLNEEQKESISKLDVHAGVEAYITCNGERIGDFKGGAVKVKLPFEIPEGYNEDGFSVWYVAEDGSTTKYESWYENGHLVFIVNHFSDYVIVYDGEDVVNKEIQEDTTYRRLRLRIPCATKMTNKLVWTRVDEADGYVIYGNQCNTKECAYEMEQKAVIEGNDVITWTDKYLKAGTYYKYYIRAYKLVNGEKVFIATSKVVHSATTGGAKGNAREVKVDCTDVTLKAGEKHTIVASQIKLEMPIALHRAIKYESTDSEIASVDAKGVVTAKKKGICHIYVYAQNGLYKTVRIEVK